MKHTEDRVKTAERLTALAVVGPVLGWAVAEATQVELFLYAGLAVFVAWMVFMVYAFPAMVSEQEKFSQLSVQSEVEDTTPSTD